MNLKHLIYCSLTLLILTSCSDDGPDVQVRTISSFSQLSIGNYWVYDWYEVEPDGSESPMQLRDTLMIESDTLIEGRRMFVRTGTFMSQPRREILYDSISHLLTYPDRLALFTLDTREEITRNFGPADAPLSVGTYRLNTVLETITVPAGEFQCLNFQGTIESLELDYPFGTRFNSNLYTEGIGLVKLTTQFYRQANDLEMRLVDFGRN